MSTITERASSTSRKLTNSPSPTKASELKVLRKKLEAAQKKIDHLEAKLGLPGSPESKTGSPERVRKMAEEASLHRAVVLVQNEEREAARQAIADAR